MAVVKVSTFPGLLPRATARGMAGAGAQVSHNLLQTSMDFRPLLGDTQIGTCPAGVKSLYRMMRDAGGVIQVGDASGWITSSEARRYVRGQINDDATERTLVFSRDGRQAPQVTTVAGDYRLLGVPAPAKPMVTLNEVAQFTAGDAKTWVDSTMIPALTDAINASVKPVDQVVGRMTAGKPRVGAYDMHGFTQSATEQWYAELRIPLADARDKGLDVTGTEGFQSGGHWVLRMMFLPFWGELDSSRLDTELRKIESPKDGSQLFSDAQIAQMVQDFAGFLDPAKAGIKSWRDELDALVRKFKKAVDDAKRASAITPRPVEPVKPTVPEFVIETSSGSDTVRTVRSPEWVAYDASMAQYRKDLRAWEDSQTSGVMQNTDTIAIIQDCQREGQRLSGTVIEAEYFKRLGKIKSYVEDWAAGKPISKSEGGGLFDVDPDRIIEDRFYLVTFKTDRGEESAPSPVTDVLAVDQNDTVDVSRPLVPADRNIVSWCVYRSATGNVSASWRLVDEVVITQALFVDQVPNSMLGQPCPSMTWAEPPLRRDPNSAATIKPPKGEDPYLRDGVAMPNGIVAAFLDNFVAFCVPYRPFAWPVEFQITTDTPIVGLGVFGQSLFVGTRAHPYIISGSSSGSMSSVKLSQEQACMSADSIVSADGAGVLYASPDGLCLANASGVQVISEGLWSREDWQVLNPASIVAASQDGVYYFWCDGGTFALDFKAMRLGTVDLPRGPIHKDYITDALYVAQDGVVWRLFSGGRRVGRYKTGIMLLPAQAPLAWLQVEGEQGNAAPVTVRWLGDGQLRHTAQIGGVDPKRLPPGRWREHVVEIEGGARVSSVLMAGTTMELQSV